ncbi:MAG: M15 family metallopeptidase [Oscillospiraceae bacterium]|nr:M15 family metallopeptidase [Oscillospiraceae bacterium]
MSNGTRIDPEEREPRAIKIRQPKKHKGLKIFFGVFSAVIIIAAGTLAFFAFGDNFEFPKIGFFEKGNEEPFVENSSEEEIPEENKEPEVPAEPESVPEEQPEIPAEPEITEEPEENKESPEPEKPEIPKDEWYMLLVNRENPLPADFALDGAAIDDDGHIVDARIFGDLSAMIDSGESEGLRFTLYTAYRTIEKQNELFAAGKTDVPGGASEHNSGLGIDIGCTFGEFEGSPEEAWLLEHAHEYGFILRYPEGKEDITGFTHEPWHFRYVGKEQALLIKESGLCLEEYLLQE